MASVSTRILQYNLHVDETYHYHNDVTYVFINTEIKAQIAGVTALLLLQIPP